MPVASAGMAQDRHSAPSETVFTWGAPALAFGRGAFDELGHHAAGLGLRRVAVVTDPRLAAIGLATRAEEALAAAGLTATAFSEVHVEPTDTSLRIAGDWARSIEVDGFVAVGGGSVIDTAKAMNLLATNDGDLSDYLNAPIGAGRAPTKPMHPLVAVPTTAGTGAESTPVCIAG